MLAVQQHDTRAKSTGEEVGTKARLVFHATQAIGRLLAQGRRLRGGPRVRSILVQRRTRLGDLVLILPMLRELRLRYPHARIVLGVAAGSPAHELLADSPDLDEIRVLEESPAEPAPIERFVAITRLLSEGFDVLVSGEAFSLLAPAFYCGAPLRVGLDDGSPLQLFNNIRVPLDPRLHAADNHLALVARLSEHSPELQSAPRLVHPPRARAPLPETLDENPYVVLHPGSQKPSRRWPAERFAELARRLLESHPGLQVVCTGVASEAALHAEIAAALPDSLRPRCHEMAGKTSLDELIPLLRQARAVVVNDTGVMHLTRAIGTPLFALLGPENDAYWGPHPTGWGSAIAFRHVVPCAPCTRWDCELLFCLRSLAVDEVFDAVAKQLGEPAPTDGGESHLELRRKHHDWGDLAARGLAPPTIVAPAFGAQVARWILRTDALADLRWGDAPAIRGDGSTVAPSPPVTMAPSSASPATDDPLRVVEEALAAAPGDFILVTGDGASPAGLGEALAALIRLPELDAIRLGPDRAVVRAERLREALRAAEELPPEPTPSLAAQLAGIATELWQARELLVQITLRDIRIRYTQAIMGFGWAVLMPALIVGAGVMIRYAMAYMSGSQLRAPEVLGMAVKAIPWAFLVGALGFATSSLTGNYQLVTKVAFPRLVLPISAVLTQAFDTAIGSVALALFVPLLGGVPSAAWLWIPLLAVLAFMLTTAVCVFASCANLFFRDVKYLVQVFLTFGIFFTPIFFEPEMLGRPGALLMMMNPLSPVVEGLRLCVTQGHDLAHTLRIVDAHGISVVVWTPWYLVYATAVAAISFLGSVLLFRRLEPVFAEYA